MKIDNLITEGAYGLFKGISGYSGLEYTGYRHEILGSKDSAYIGTSLCDSPTYEVTGPDASKFMSSICVNDFSNVNVGSIRHALICNEKGQMMTDGVAMKVAEDTYRTYWLHPVIEYHLHNSNLDVKGTDLSGQIFFYQVAGPKSLEILEAATQSNLRDINFAKHRTATISGIEVRILRLGMAGTLAYEVHGDSESAETVYKALWDAGQKHQLRKLGRIAYCMNHTEAGFPNIYIHFPMPWFEDPGFAEFLNQRPGMGFMNENRKLTGSLDDAQQRFKTPYDVGWGKLINFNHDFVGKDALLQLKETHNSSLVTLEWNADDVAEIYASQFKGHDVESYDPIERPSDLNFNVFENGTPLGIYFHADKVLCDGKLIGNSSGRIHSVYYKRMLSLGFIDAEYAIEGKELSLLWGSPGKPQKEIRVTVARCPYINLTQNRDIDVSNL